MQKESLPNPTLPVRCQTSGRFSGACMVLRNTHLGAFPVLISDDKPGSGALRHSSFYDCRDTTLTSEDRIWATFTDRAEYWRRHGRAYPSSH